MNSNVSRALRYIFAIWAFLFHLSYLLHFFLLYLLLVLARAIKQTRCLVSLHFPRQFTWFVFHLWSYICIHPPHRRRKVQHTDGLIGLFLEELHRLGVQPGNTSLNRN